MYLFIYVGSDLTQKILILALSGGLRVVVLDSAEIQCCFYELEKHHKYETERMISSESNSVVEAEYY
jgi:hypothetical protein